MKKKGFCFKRAVSLLLAAAMILTAAPQTGLTAFAAENSDISVDPQVLSADDTLADEESNENDTDVDTTQPEDGQDETQLPEESGDGSENGGDVLPEDPGQEGNPDDAEEPGEVTESADGQEGDGEDAEGIASEEETVSENALDVELMANDDPEKQEESEEYLGRTNEEEQQDGTKYKVLEIGAFERNGLNDDKPWTDAQILEKLKKWQEKTERFECVRLCINDIGAKSRVIKKELLNAAIALLNTENAEAECWIDYNFQKKPSDENMPWECMSFTLNNPGTATGDINANVTVTPVARQGVKLKFPTVNFNAEQVVVNFEGVADSGAIKESLARAEDVRYYLFTMKSGQFEAHDEEGCDNGGYEANDNRFWVNDVCRLKANTDYLMAPVEDFESMSAGDTKQWTIEGATNVKGKSYTPDIASISIKDNKPELSAWEQGEALFGVTYTMSGVSRAEFYRMQVGTELYKIDFLEKEITMEVGDNTYLNVVCYPSDAGVDSGDLEWIIEPAQSANVVIAFETDDDKKMRGGIKALKPGEVTVKAVYKKDTANPQANETPQEDRFTATCTINVKGRLDCKDVETEVEKMDLYAVSGCDMTLGDVKFPKELQDKWKWTDEKVSLAPYAGSEGHEFAATCTKDGVSGDFTVFVRMVNATGIVMQSRRPGEDSQGKAWTEWDRWGVPSVLEKDDKLSLGFWFELENCDENNEDEWNTVQNRLRDKYAVEWSTNPKDPGDAQDDGTYEYTASILKKPEKAEKKAFTVSLKDTATKKVVYKASHTLTVTTGNLFDWEPIKESYYWENLKSDYDDQQGKLISLTLTVKMPKTEYDKWKLTYTSLDNTILQLKAPTVTKGSDKDENGQDIETTIVKIPCTQKSTGRVWIQITAQDEIKSSERFDINLEDKVPTILGAATQTINKASTVKSVPIIVSTSESFPLVKKGDGTPDVSIREVKIGSKAVSDVFELTGIEELSNQEAAAILKEGDSTPRTYIGVYRMNLGLKSEQLSGVKTGNYAVKLSFKTAAVWEKNEEEDQTVSLTVKVTDVKPKVTFKQTGKVNLFYTDGEGVGTLQVISDEKVTSVSLEDYEDKSPSKNAECHYVVYPKTDENGDREEDVYEIARKDGAKEFNEKLKKGTLKYTVDGYEGTFQTTFTVATENKAPAIVLSTKSDTLYPSVWYMDSWISIIDKATGEAVQLNGEKRDEAYYVVKGKGASKEALVIGAFKHEDPDGDEQKGQEKEIRCSASGNTYGFFVTDDGNIVSRLREIDEKNSKKADTINLELQKNNWSKPVALSYKLQVDSTLKPKLTLGKATLTLNKNADVYRGQQERTTLRLKGCGNNVMQDDDNWVNITGQDDKSKAELKGKDSSLIIWYWNGDVFVRFNDNKIDAGTYKFKISVANSDVSAYASTVLTVKIVDKAVKQSLKVTAKGSIDVLNREGTFISYTPKISNLTGTVVEGRLAGKDANLFDYRFEDGKLIVRAFEGRKYSTKITYEVHTVFRVQTEDWREYEISSDNDAKAKPFKIKVKQGKPKLTAAAVGSNTIYRQRDNRVDIRIEAILGKQEVEIEDVWLLNYGGDMELIPTRLQVEDDKEWSDDYLRMEKEGEYVIYNPETKSVRVALQDVYNCDEIRKNGTYKLKFAVRYRDKASDVKETEITCPIIVR